MQNRTFGRTGLSVSPLGFGAAPIGWLRTDRDRVADILNLLLDHGMNVIDTASGYAASEEVIGGTVGHRRSETVLVTKCGRKLPSMEGEDWSEPVISTTIDRSLARLKTGRLDVMLLHSCELEVLKRGEAVAALAKAKKAGKIRFAGYSGDNEPAAYAAALPDIDVIETSINITDQANIDRVLSVARKHNCGVLAKRPIANAAWKKPEDQPGVYRDYAQPYVDRLKKMQLTPESLGFTGPPDDVWPEIALRFTLSFPEVHNAIIGTTNPDNARRNIEYAAKGPLPDEAVKKIRSAFKRADPAGEWEGLS